MNTWKYIKLNIDTDDIRNFEKMTGVSLPQPVADFIVKNNNGRPHFNGVDMPSGDGHIFEKLLSFNQGDVENVFSTYENIKDDLKSGLIPVALDPFGNYFCLNSRNDFQVEFWKHESKSTENTGKDLLALIKALH